MAAPWNESLWIMILHARSYAIWKFSSLRVCDNFLSALNPLLMSLNCYDYNNNNNVRWTDTIYGENKENMFCCWIRLNFFPIPFIFVCSRVVRLQRNYCWRARHTRSLIKTLNRMTIPTFSLEPPLNIFVIVYLYVFRVNSKILETKIEKNKRIFVYK